MQSAYALETPVAASCPRSRKPPRNGTLESEFRDFIASDDFPCVGSKLALARGGLRAVELAPLGDVSNDAFLLDTLAVFARHLDAGEDDSTDVHSLVALFRGPCSMDESAFERQLWNQLQRLHDLDVARGTPWARDVDRDPASPRFSMSLAGHPFFIIGLHPGSSRLARRFTAPALVFNSHRQFNRLREDGRFAKMQKATRARDIALQGSINPNLSDHGEASEARQYSGRAVEAGWRCPFRARSGA